MGIRVALNLYNSLSCCHFVASVMPRTNSLKILFLFENVKGGEYQLKTTELILELIHSFFSFYLDIKFGTAKNIQAKLQL